MPLTRYQIRNEYGLADPELYRDADKDDPEALYEGIAMAGLVGVLRQLGDLAEFAAVIFHDLHEEVMVTAARGHGLMLRAQQLEAEVPSIEKAFLSQTNHSLFLLNAGVDWHPNLRMDENLITREDLPRCVLDFYEECRGPPRLFLLEKFDVAGAGACLKRYSDPSFFKAKFTSSETMGADIQRERKARKVKKKRSCWRNGENREVYPTSHSKLHQLLSEERNSENNVLMHHVKLKKRQLNGFPSESTTGKSYMERFVETNSSDSKISYKDTLVLPQLNIESCNTSEQGLEIREISTASPASKLLQRERGLHSSGERQETPLEQSMYDLHEDVIKEGILKKLHEPTCDIVVGKVPSRLYKLKDRNELMVVVESQKEASVDGYQSDDTTSEVDNYMDALASIESEMEMDTGSRPHNDRGFFNTMRLGIDSDTKEQQKHQDQFSDSHSIGNSSKSDDENNLFNRGRYNPSKMDTLSNLAVKGPLGRDAVAEIASSAGTCSTEIEDVSSEKPTSNVDTSVTETLEYVVPSGSCIEVSEMPRSGSELVEASPDFCVTDSNSAVSHLSPGDNLYEFQLEGPDFVGFEGPSSNTEEDTENLCIDVPCTTNLSDSAIKMKDDALAEEFVRRQQVEVMDGLTLELSSDALLHRSDISGLVVARKDNGGTLDTKCAEDGPTENMNRNNDSPHSVTLPTEEQLSCLEGQDVKVCSSTRRPECLPASTNTDDLDDLKSGRTLETDTEIQTTREKPKYLTSALDIQKTGDFSKQDLSEMTEEVPPPQMDLRVGSGSSGGKTLYNNLVVSSNTPDCGVSDEPTPDVIQSNSCGSVGKGTAASSEFPSLYLTPESTNAASVTDYYSQTDSLSDTVHAEADADSVMYRKLIGSSNCTKLQEECLPCSRDLGGLVSEVHAQLDDMEPVRVHAEAADEDTAVFGRLIGSPSRNHVKLEDECPATDGNVSDIENKVHSKLDNLTTGAAHTEADDADTADCPNLIGSSLKIQMKLQEECLSDACSEWCKLETIEARNPKFIIGEGAQIERNQLAVASTDLNVEVYDSESHGPSSSELLYDVQHAQSHLHLRNVTVVPQSSVEMDNLLQFVHQSRPSEHSEAPMCNSLSNQEQRIPSEQALVLEAGQLIVESLHGEGESLLLSNILDEQTQSLDGRDQNCCDSVPPEISLVEKTEPVKHGDLDGSSGGAPEFSCIDPLKQHPETDFPLVPTSHNMVTCGPTIDSLASSFPSFGMLSGTTHEQSSKPQPSQGPNATQAYVEAPPLPPLPPLQWRVGKFRDSSLTAEGEMVQSSLNPFLPLGFTLLGGEIVQPLSPIVPQNSTGVGEHQHGSKALGRDVVHPDLNSFSSQLPAVVGDANNKQGSQTSDIEETQLPNPFLPLPATEDEKHEHELIPLGEEKSQPNLNSFASSPATEEVKATFDTLQGESCDLQNLSGPEPKMNDGTMKDEEPLNSFAPPIIKEEESLNSFAPPTIKEEEPLNSFAPPYIKQEEPASLTLEGEMPSNASTSFPNAKVGVPNGKPPKQPRPRDPLIEAVASHDRSMLRKATERVRPQIVPKMDERGSLLDQIRTKSFSLKPVVRPMLATRPSVQGPRTNLKIAAILEKANSIRQATAGSDEDDDSWSDS